MSSILINVADYESLADQPCAAAGTPALTYEEALAIPRVREAKHHAEMGLAMLKGLPQLGLRIRDVMVSPSTLSGTVTLGITGVQPRPAEVDALPDGSWTWQVPVQRSSVIGAVILAVLGVLMTLSVIAPLVVCPLLFGHAVFPGGDCKLAATFGFIYGFEGPFMCMFAAVVAHSALSTTVVFRGGGGSGKYVTFAVVSESLLRRFVRRATCGCFCHSAPAAVEHVIAVDELNVRCVPRTNALVIHVPPTPEQRSEVIAGALKGLQSAQREGQSDTDAEVCRLRGASARLPMSAKSIVVLTSSNASPDAAHRRAMEWAAFFRLEA